MKITKAMVLCAGLGTRLQPITSEMPKPLVPVLNIPNVLHSLFLLKEAGITEVILNLFHLPHVLENFLREGSDWGMKISYSRETELMGTGGGVKMAEAFFGNDPFVLLNCDFVSDIDLRPLIENHLASKALATMVLMQDAVLEKKYSRVGVTESGELCSLPKFQSATPFRQGIFTGIHFLSAKALGFLPLDKCGINDVLYPTLMKDHASQVRGEFTQAYWYDTGEPHTLLEASMALLKRLLQGDTHLRAILERFGKYEERSPGIWVHPETTIAGGVELEAPCIIGRSCSLRAPCKIGPFTILGDATTVEANHRTSYLVSIGETLITEDAFFPEGVFRFKAHLFQTNI